MGKKEVKNTKGHKHMRAKLSFDEGFSKRPIYKVVAPVTDKEAGLSMLELIYNNFNIKESDRIRFIQDAIKDQKKIALSPPIKWTRDEKGKIVSPFRSERRIYKGGD